MKKVVLVLAFAVFAISAASCAFAEDPSTHGSGEGFHHKKKEFLQQKKEELRQRLNLSEEQKEKAKQLRMEARPTIKPIMEEMHQKLKELKEMKQAGASKEELMAKHDEIKNLREQANSIRKENMTKFESILDSGQKAEFQTFKEEMKQKREEYRQHRKEKRMQRRNKYTEPAEE